MGLRNEGSEFRFKVYLGFRVQGLGLGFRVWELRFI